MQSTFAHNYVSEITKKKRIKKINNNNNYKIQFSVYFTNIS